MATNPYWPLVVDQIAFTGDPNDPNATPTYTDVTARVRSFEASRGRQYEIDQNQTGEAHLVMSDKDEVLNPANTSAPAPYNGNIKPYRRYLRQAMWPPAPITTADTVTFRQVTSTTSGTGTASSFTVQLPADVQVGDDLLIAVATCANSVFPTVASSWIPVHGGTATGSGSVSLGLWRRSVTAADIAAGSFTGTYTAAYTFTVMLIGVDLKLGQNACYTVVSGQGVAESTSGTSHTTPSATVGYQESALIGLFVQGDPSPGWAAGPAGDTILARATSNNPVGNNAAVMVTGSPLVGTGTYSRTATTNTATANALMSLVSVSVDNSVNLLPSQGIDPSFESYSSGTSLPWVLTVGSGVNPTVQAANPHDGTKSLQYATTAGTGTNGVGLVVNCIPGQQYTSSMWIRQTAANTILIFINGGAAGSSTSVTGSYVRLSVTWTASQATHQLWVTSSGTSISGTVNVDSIQHEPGSTATAFSTNGPTIYTPFVGYVERWPTSWNHQGTYGLCSLTCVDAMAVLAGTDLHTEYRSMLLSKKPDYYWPLADGSNATTYAEVSGNGGPPLNRMDAPAGPAPTFTPGTQVTIAGDPGATGVTIAGGDPTVLNGPATVLATGIRNTPQVNVGSASKPFSVSALLWLSHQDVNLLTQQIYPIIIADTNFGNYLMMAYQGDAGTGGTIGGWQAQINPANGSTNAAMFPDDHWGDQKPHMFVLAATIGASTGHLNLFVDGVQVATSGSIDTTSWVGPFNMGVVEIGGGIIPSTSQNVSPLPNGIYDHLAIWNRELSAQDVTDLWTAAKGYPGETSGQRIARLLSVGGYTGPTAIDTGQSVMDVSTVTEGAALLDACQAVTLSENGNLYVESGTVTAKSRTDRYLKTTATWVFGENQASGEYPYEADIAYDYDPSRVVNDVTVTRVNGARANATDATSQKQYFRRSYQRTVGIQSDLETIDAANYLLNKGKQPIQRIARLSIKPSANPALWPASLGARIGDRVTVKRRTPAFTMSADFFIEKITHDNEPGSWVTSFEMSPADRSQVWILGDSTYGQLGITTVLGF